MSTGACPYCNRHIAEAAWLKAGLREIAETTWVTPSAAKNHARLILSSLRDLSTDEDHDAAVLRPPTPEGGEPA